MLGFGAGCQIISNLLKNPSVLTKATKAQAELVKLVDNLLPYIIHNYTHSYF